MFPPQLYLSLSLTLFEFLHNSIKIKHSWLYPSSEELKFYFIQPLKVQKLHYPENVSIEEGEATPNPGSRKVDDVRLVIVNENIFHVEIAMGHSPAVDALKETLNPVKTWLTQLPPFQLVKRDTGNPRHPDRVIPWSPKVLRNPFDSFKPLERRNLQVEGNLSQKAREHGSFTIVLLNTIILLPDFTFPNVPGGSERGI
jgi:hypothetical protein